jgi:hypothetical protein
MTCIHSRIHRIEPAGDLVCLDCDTLWTLDAFITMRIDQAIERNAMKMTDRVENGGREGVETAQPPTPKGPPQTPLPTFELVESVRSVVRIYHSCGADELIVALIDPMTELTKRLRKFDRQNRLNVATMRYEPVDFSDERCEPDKFGNVENFRAVDFGGERYRGTGLELEAKIRAILSSHFHGMQKPGSYVGRETEVAREIFDLIADNFGSDYADGKTDSQENTK